MTFDLSKSLTIVSFFKLEEKHPDADAQSGQNENENESAIHVPGPRYDQSSSAVYCGYVRVRDSSGNHADLYKKNWPDPFTLIPGMTFKLKKCQGSQSPTYDEIEWNINSRNIWAQIVLLYWKCADPSQQEIRRNIMRVILNHSSQSPEGDTWEHALKAESLPFEEFEQVLKSAQDCLDFARKFRLTDAQVARTSSEFFCAHPDQIESDPYTLSIDQGFAPAYIKVCDSIALSIQGDRPSPRQYAGRVNTYAARATLDKRKVTKGTWFQTVGVLEQVNQRLREFDLKVVDKLRDTLRGFPGRAVVFEDEQCAIRGDYDDECYIADRLVAMSELSISPIQATASLILDDILKRDIFPEAKGVQAAEELLTILRQNVSILDFEQKKVILATLRVNVVCIIGGAGNGKTLVMQTLRALLTIASYSFESCHVSVLAPTGKAAQRVRGETIHGLIYGPERSPGPVLFDEHSMCSPRLFAEALRSMPTCHMVVCCGDPNQLPSIEPGCLFRDMIQSGCITVCELTKVYRQGEGCSIVEAGKQVRRAQAPTANINGSFRIHWLTTGTKADVVDIVCKLYKDFAGKRPHMDLRCQAAVMAVSLTCKMAESVNNRMLEYFRGLKTERVTTACDWETGDSVMFGENNYDRGPTGVPGPNRYCNGELGQVIGINSTNVTIKRESDLECATIGFVSGGKRRKLAAGKIKAAYAMTIHKSQGSEAENVVVVLDSTYYTCRELLYTAITRAQKRCVLVCTREALKCALKTSALDRVTRLRKRIRQTADLCPRCAAIQANQDVYDIATGNCQVDWIDPSLRCKICNPMTTSF